MRVETTSGTPIARRLAVVAVAVLIGLGCNTPQIPLPPPTTKDFALTNVDATKKEIRFKTQEIGTTASTASGLLDKATLYFYNKKKMVGVIAHTDAAGEIEGSGKQSAALQADEGDQIEVQYQPDGRIEISEKLCLIVKYSATTFGALARTSCNGS